MNENKDSSQGGKSIEIFFSLSIFIQEWNQAVENLIIQESDEYS